MEQAIGETLNNLISETKLCVAVDGSTNSGAFDDDLRECMRQLYVAGICLGELVSMHRQRLLIGISNNEASTDGDGAAASDEDERKRSRAAQQLQVRVLRSTISDMP